MRNIGPGTATDVALKGKLPGAAKKVKGDCKLGKVKHGKRKFSCDLGDIQTGKRGKVKVLAPSLGARKPKLVARARVSSSVTDPVAKNNRAKAVVKVAGAAR